MGVLRGTGGVNQSVGRRWLRAALATAVTVALLSWALAEARTDDVVARLAELRWRWLGVAAMAVPLQVVLAAERWKRVSDPLGLPLERRAAIGEYASSTLLNQLLPGGVAGDAVRVWRHGKAAKAVGGPVRAAVLDRWLGQTVLTAVALVGVVRWTTVHPGTAPPAGAGPGVGLILMGLLAVLVVPATVPVVGPLARDARRTVVSRRGLPMHLLLSMALVGSFVVGFWASAQAVGCPLGGALGTVVPLLLLVMALPVTIGGWGLREATAAVLLPLLGWTAADALAVTTVYGLSQLVGALPAVGLLWVRGWQTTPDSQTDGPANQTTARPNAFAVSDQSGNRPACRRAAEANCARCTGSSTPASASPRASASPGSTSTAASAGTVSGIAPPVVLTTGSPRAIASESTIP